MTLPGSPGGARRRLRAPRAALSAAVILGLGVTGPAVAAVRVSTRVVVTPGSGRPTTAFVLRLRLPVATGTMGSVTRRDVLSVRGPHATGCASATTSTLRSGRRGARRTVTLNPRRLAGAWCPGEFRGQVVQYTVVRCAPGPAHACPDFALAPATIARFRFHVNPAPAGTPGPADVPHFAGLISATTCDAPVPAVLPRPSIYTLTWQAATDPVTASSGIVYEIFLATTSGAEDYAQPTWTTSPGVTSFTTPAVPRTGPVYFVVRARNGAGVQDANTIERQGVSDCGPAAPGASESGG